MQPHAGEAQLGGVVGGAHIVGGAHRALAGAIDDRPSSSNNEIKPPGAMQEPHVRPVVVRAPSQISTGSQLLAGGVAGAFSKTCTAPLARLTILFQVQGMRADGAIMSSPSILKEATRIFREEGLRAFWKGNGVTIVHRLPYSSINFFAYEQYKMHFRKIMGIEGNQESLGVGMGTRLLAGGGAGITAASLTYPLDLVRTRLAAQTKEMYYRGISHALLTITRDEGYRGLYKGMGTTLMMNPPRKPSGLSLISADLMECCCNLRYGVGRALLKIVVKSQNIFGWGFSDAQPTLAHVPRQGVGPNIAINFCVYETLKSMWVARRPDMSPALVSLACGSLAGICSSTATFPIDLVRRRMQLEGAGGKAKVYTSGLGGTFKEIVAKEGVFGLYRGILPEYYKVIPSVGIVFMTYEFMKRILRPGAWDGL